MLPSCPTAAGGPGLNQSACAAAGCCFHSQAAEEQRVVRRSAQMDAAIHEARATRCTLMGGGLKKGAALNYSAETIDRWRRTTLNTTRLAADRLPISSAYASAPHTEFEYIRDHLGYRLELEVAEFPGSVGAGTDFEFTSTLLNWGFAAPINPRPVQLVLLSQPNTASQQPRAAHIVWRSESLADVREWQPYEPGDPTFSPLRHTFKGTVRVPPAVNLHCPGFDWRNDSIPPRAEPQVAALPETVGCTLMLGLIMPDLRPGLLGDTSAAYSIRLANEIPWLVIAGADGGGVNVLGKIIVTTS